MSGVGAAPDHVLETELKEAQRLGLPSDWRLEMDGHGMKRWVCPNPLDAQNKYFYSMTTALAYAQRLDPLLSAKKSTTPTNARKRQLSSKKQTSASGTKSKKAKTTKSSSLKPRDTATDPSLKHSSSKATQKKSKISKNEKRLVYDSDPETSLDIPENHDEDICIKKTGSIRTVHWDPNSEAGQQVGSRIRVYNTEKEVWESGRIIRYDPVSHKHKIYFFTDEDEDYEVMNTSGTWLDLNREHVQIGGKFVWALVKGYPWWPGQILEVPSRPNLPKSSRLQSDLALQPCRQGYVLVEFFDSDEVSSIKDTPDFIRPFNNGKVDSFIAKNKRKRNQKAIEGGMQELQATSDVRGDAIKFYATKAFYIANIRAKNLLGKRVEVYNSEVNYLNPQAGSVEHATVRQYSSSSKKWLVAYDNDSSESKWVNLMSKGNMYKVLNRKKKHQPDGNDLYPYSFGYDSMKNMCRACVKDCDPGERDVLTCDTCSGVYHPGCLDPPITRRSAENMKARNEKWVCPKCTPCMGCRELDIVFGTKMKTPPQSLALEAGQTTVALCSSCIPRYENDMFCPICAHVWDDVRYRRVRERMEKYEKSDAIITPSIPAEKDRRTIVEGSKHVWPSPSTIDPSVFYPEINAFGYNESTMISCDKCNLWVHAACAGLEENEYKLTNEGKHPIYSKEFLCRSCTKKQAHTIVEKLQEEDKMYLFAVPVTDKIAHNYHDIIQNPMDLKTISEECNRGQYRNYSWIRESFELMVYNALTFNAAYSTYWNEARRYYIACLLIFNFHGKGAPQSKYASLIQTCFIKAEQEIKAEKDRVKEDKTAEKKDLFAGANVSSIELGPLATPADPPSCVPCTVVTLTSIEAFFCSWMESCVMCGSSGASDTMLFCVDCGEAYHSFCAAAPIHSMNEAAINSWRCANCKTCEITGEAPVDETRLLYCDVCDRAFSLDALHPPLSKVPKGLWICGQCVDCKTCKNTSHMGKVSRASWSFDQQKCHSCCNKFSTTSAGKRKHSTEPIRFEIYQQHVCSDERWLSRSTFDNDYRTLINDAHVLYKILTEKGFRFYVMLKEAQEHMKIPKLIVTRATRFLRKKNYRRKNAADHLYEEMQSLYVKGEMASAFLFVSCSFLRLPICWKKLDVLLKPLSVAGTKEPLFSEGLYLEYIHDHPTGIVSYGGDNNVVDYAMSKSLPIPLITFTKDIATNIATIEKIDESDRFQKRYDRNKDRSRKQMTVLKDEEKSEKTANHKELVKLPWYSTGHKKIKPLTGWSNLDYMKEQQPRRWFDPRVCCLCMASGDDDAGVPSTEVSGITEVGDSIRDKRASGCGRLLPMPGGSWVHAGCAVWSSEVWEGYGGGSLQDVSTAKTRGSKLRCFGCGRLGATLGCHKTHCNATFHFACAKASNATFTENHKLYCSIHKECSKDKSLNPDTFEEYMKTLRIQPIVDPQRKDDGIGSQSCHRIGTLVIHSLGRIVERGGFHCEKYITPPGFCSSRIFWSFTRPKSRTLYIMRIDRTDDNAALFSILAADSPQTPFQGRDVTKVFQDVIERVTSINEKFRSSPKELFSIHPRKRSLKKSFHVLNGPQFFGFGIDQIRKMIENMPGSLTCAVPLTKSCTRYKFCFKTPKKSDIMDLQRKRAAILAEKELENTSGCARTEGSSAVLKSSGSGRITRALVRKAEEDVSCTVVPEEKAADVSGVSSKREFDSNQAKYHAMKSVPLDQRLVAKRSHIHGWGLFTKMKLSKHSMIIEYMGEMVRQPIADLREKEYEKSGLGSCYMFRLDKEHIVDATAIGCMARFMNHCCAANAYSKVVSVQTHQGMEKKIVVFANRNIDVGEEITYDYKFPVEDGSLRCTCGAPNCIGRMN